MALEPQQNWQNQVKDAEQGRIGQMNALAISVILELSIFVNRNLSRIFESPQRSRTVMYRQLETRIQRQYATIYTGIKSDILNSLNESGLEQRFLATNTLGRQPRVRQLRTYKRLPTTSDFRITNRILSEKTFTRVNRRLSKRVTRIIRQSVDMGRSIDRTTSLLEREFGLRDRQFNRLTPRARSLLRSGRFAKTNGHFYHFYRIARTESLRMSSIRSNELYDDLLTREDSARLQLVSVIDNRTREQSINMNGQIADQSGRFLYPDGRRYRHGEAPARWTINDRETTITIFETDEDRGNLNYKTLSGFKRANA